MLDLAGRLTKAYTAYSHRENSTRPIGNPPTYLIQKSCRILSCFGFRASGDSARAHPVSLESIKHSICWCIELVRLQTFDSHVTVTRFIRIPVHAFPIPPPSSMPPSTPNSPAIRLLSVYFLFPHFFCNHKGSVWNQTGYS